MGCARLLNEKCAWLAQMMGRLYGSNRDFQSKSWAKSRNLGQPYTVFVLTPSPAGPLAPDAYAQRQFRALRAAAGPGCEARGGPPSEAVGRDRIVTLHHRTFIHSIQQIH